MGWIFQELYRFMNDKLATIGIPAPVLTSESFVTSRKVLLQSLAPRNESPSRWEFSPEGGNLLLSGTVLQRVSLNF